MSKYNKILYAAIFLSIFAFISSYYNRQQFKGHINENLVGMKINKDIKLKSLINDKIKNMYELNHEDYILAFMSSWCGLCGDQYKIISKIREKFSIPIYAIGWQDHPQNIKQYIEAGKYQYDHVYWDIDNKLSNSLKLYALPTIVLMGPGNEVKFVATGVINDQVIEKYIIPKLSPKL